MVATVHSSLCVCGSDVVRVCVSVLSHVCGVRERLYNIAVRNLSCPCTCVRRISVCMERGKLRQSTYSTGENRFRNRKWRGKRQKEKSLRWEQTNIEYNMAKWESRSVESKRKRTVSYRTTVEALTHERNGVCSRAAFTLLQRVTQSASCINGNSNIMMKTKTNGLTVLAPQYRIPFCFHGLPGNEFENNERCTNNPNKTTKQQSESNNSTQLTGSKSKWQQSQMISVIFHSLTHTQPCPHNTQMWVFVVSVLWLKTDSHCILLKKNGIERIRFF